MLPVVEALFLAIAASVSVASLMLWSQARRAAGKRQAQLPAGDRTALTAQIGDVVGHLDRDWLVEGALALSESPRAARLCRIIDGAQERFLYATSSETRCAWLLGEVGTLPDGRPDELRHEGELLRLERRWRASVLSAGRMGRRAFEPELTIHEYTASSGRFALFLDGANGHAMFFGERVMSHALEILPGKG
jgi:hypothetical protein